MSGISFSCPSCGAQIPVPDGDDPCSCPKCGYAMSESGSSGMKNVRRCMNCKKELRSGITICPQCGTDQETGRRSFGSGKRKQPEAEGRDGDGLQKERSFPLSAFAALLVLGAGISACVFFLSRASPDTPLLPPAKTTSPLRPPKVQPIGVESPVSPSSSNVEVKVVPQVHADDSLKAAISRYEIALRQGRVDSANQARLQAEHRFAGGATSASFWRQTFAPTTCVSVTMCYICTVCTDGTCPVCHNSPECASCKGTGICKGCGGVPTRQVACPSCVCPTCDGNGRCDTCSGSGTIGCPTCNANGYKDSRNTIACSSCNGTGQRRGLRTADGYMPVKCLTCGGTGRITQHVRVRCVTCNGQSRIKCQACSGGGLCAACKGTGRTPGCTVCGGKGVIDVVCKTCGGSRKCPTCSGAGHCQRCLGTGVCYLCRKSGLIRETHLPASASWLVNATGYVLFDTVNQKIVSSGDRTGRQEIAWNGRSLMIDVSPNEVVWISTTPSFQNITRLFAPRQATAQSNVSEGVKHSEPEAIRR